VAHREDFLRKLNVARQTRGCRFLVMLSPCPVGWKSSSDESIELVDLAVRSGLFPLYEVFDGERYTINVRPDGTDLREYLSRQRRYAGTSLDVDAAAARIARQWRTLETLAEQFPA
jgi:pyruvate ferredoxin oxidoreductase beta subunit/2-oxoisovalerate ferredoxin oxidoreductase beta subunit